MTERASPFYCPYCADEGLRPMGEGHGDWRCSACRRAFRLRYLGLTGSDGMLENGEAGSTAEARQHG